MVPRFLFHGKTKKKLSSQYEVPFISGWYKTLPFPRRFYKTTPFVVAFWTLSMSFCTYLMRKTNWIGTRQVTRMGDLRMEPKLMHTQPEPHVTRRGEGCPGCSPCHVVMMMDSYTFRHGCIFEGRSVVYEIHSIIHVHLVNLVNLEVSKFMDPSSKTQKNTIETTKHNNKKWKTSSPQHQHPSYPFLLSISIPPVSVFPTHPRWEPYWVRCSNEDPWELGGE